MRITVDIPEDKLDELLEITGEKKMSPAVSKAVVEFLEMKKSATLGKLIKSGHFKLKQAE
ncbi:MAG: DUF2191 domain-containing protein [Opitutales bacterium]|nr:DUF2191 domain-containing protein [Opitutales bacterium]